MPYQGRISRAPGSQRLADKRPLNKRSAVANRQSQTDLVWAVMDAAKPFLSEDARAWVFTSIGAGEHESVIVDMLHRFANDRFVLPAELHAQLSAWVAGYRGSADEDELTSLLSRVRPNALSTRVQARCETVGLVSQTGENIAAHGGFRDATTTGVEMRVSDDNVAESEVAKGYSKLRFAEQAVQCPGGSVNDAMTNHQLLDLQPVHRRLGGSRIVPNDDGFSELAAASQSTEPPHKSAGISAL